MPQTASCPQTLDRVHWGDAGRGSTSPLDDWGGERWVDIRDEGVRAVLLARLDLAAERGCDGVEPDNVTAFDDDSGFDLTRDDQLEFNRLLAAAARDRGLLIGLKNGTELIPDLVDDFDFVVNEQCVEYGECDAYGPFVEAGRSVFGAEYSDGAVSDPERGVLGRRGGRHQRLDPPDRPRRFVPHRVLTRRLLDEPHQVGRETRRPGSPTPLAAVLDRMAGCRSG